METDKIIIIQKDDLEELLEKLLSKYQGKVQERFISAEKAKHKLGISSSSALWALRSSGKISYFQDPDHKKVILYCSLSIEEYLEKNLKSSF